MYYHSPCGISLHSLLLSDSGEPVDYTFDAVNPAFETLTGLKASEVVGRSARQVLKTTDRSFLDRVIAVAQTGQGATFEFWSVPLKQRLRMTALRHKPGGFLTFFDLAPPPAPPESEAERARYQTFFELSNAANLILDAESHYILDANKRAQEFYGWSKAELQTMRMEQINVQVQEEVDRVFQETALGLKGHYFFRHRIRSGEIRDVEVYTTDGPWAGGRANYAIVQDISEAKRLERQALQAERLKAVGELTTSLSHEFGNLLSILFSQIQLMELEMPKSALSEKSRDQVQTLFQRARRLVESVKRFSRDQPIDGEVLRLSPFLEDLVVIENPACRRARIEVEFVPCPDDWVKIDAALVQQVFLNLFKNAVEALAETPDPRILLRVARENQEVVVRFTNNGQAISDEVKARLFTPFFTTKHRQGQEGTGLGLSYSLSVIHNHGGTLLLEDGTPTTFQVRLPLCPAPRDSVL